MVDWAKVGRYAGYAFLISVILVSVAAIVGVALLQSTPCYKGALKSTGSHMLALRMASACHNDGYPLPLSNPPLLNLEDITAQNKSGKSGTRKKPTTVTGWIIGVALSAAMSLIVFGVVSYLMATRGKKGGEASTQARDAGETWTLLDSIQKRTGVEVPEATLEDIAKGLMDTHRAGDVTSGEAIQKGLLQTNSDLSQNDLTPNSELVPGRENEISKLAEAVREAKSKASLAHQQIENSGQANAQATVVANEELDKVGEDLSMVDASVKAAASSGWGVANFFSSAKDLVFGTKAEQNAEAAEAKDFTPEHETINPYGEPLSGGM